MAIKRTVELEYDYPRTVYIVPGARNGAGFLPGKTYDELLVKNDAEMTEALSAGFFPTPNEAADAFDKAKAK